MGLVALHSLRPCAPAPPLRPPPKVGSLEASTALQAKATADMQRMLSDAEWKVRCMVGWGGVGVGGGGAWNVVGDDRGEGPAGRVEAGLEDRRRAGQGRAQA